MNERFTAIFTGVIAVTGIITFFTTLCISKKNTKRKRHTALNNTLHATRDLLDKLKHPGMEVRNLDEWIFDKKIFTIKERVLNSLDTIITYWMNNELVLHENLKHQPELLKAVEGTYQFARLNKGNETPPKGSCNWKEIEQLKGMKLEAIFTKVEEELKNKKEKLTK